ncbi:MAG: 3-hydroxyacyl-CoA dehydrogenase NAD-binding domain-containing protein [Gammaproteobacteria bacterium]|jgi:3-hydroxyacyl-CoA dehydrogenase/enoyl-CoA hydratase/3-hydroxybutyryl-CoA epimerase|nr:3-hydroxyacyl-CoA dehydrogenase NAD-binding domain-containing protein [Gammaproteobacteria bacterium]
MSSKQPEPDSPVRNWTLETDPSDIAWLGLRTAGSTNVLSRQVLLELDTVLDALYTAPPNGLIIFSPKETGFIAGADVNEFPELKSEDQAYEQVRAGQRVLDRLAALPFPTVAAIDGVALGGGLELALACDWRIAIESERSTLGLPEVQLGVHPGLGGTVRAVQVMGVRNAMQLMLTGKPIKPAKALRQKLVDRVTTRDSWRTDAAEFALRTPVSRRMPLPDLLLNLAPVRPLLAKILRKQVAVKANPGHYPAPQAIINLWQKYGAGPPGFDAEALSFARLVFTPASQNLVRVFFLQDRLKGLAKIADIEVRHVHVVGAGTMGADIAAWCAIRGMSVTLQDREKRFVDGGLEKAQSVFKRKLKDADRIAEASKRLVGDLTGEGAHSADLVIEAIFEDLEAKQALFKEIEERARPDALLATNTSSIPLKLIAGSLNSPQRLVGLHFFNPVALMPLVEVVHTSTTLHAAIDVATAFVKQIGKLPLPCRGLPGFLVNRILAPYLDEAIRLQEEGVAPESIDQAARDFGMPVGPLELADSVGLDILLHVATILADTIHRPLPPALKQLVADKRLGEKSGRGFYYWENGKPRKQSDTPPAGVEVQQRLILSLVNEAAACLEDHVVADADLADAGTIFGAGFAPFRGGPLQYARTEGLPQIRAALESLQRQYGDRFAPSAGWGALESEGSPNP